MRSWNLYWPLAFATAFSIIITGCGPAKRTSSPATQTATTTNLATAPATNPVNATTYPKGIADDIQKSVVALLRTNGGCVLPCFWGIVPGQTSWNQAQDIVGVLGSVTPWPDQDGGMPRYVTVLDHFQGPSAVIHRIEFTVGDDVVERISVHVEDHAYPDFDALWSAYSLSAFMRSLGTPTNAFAHVSEIDLGYAVLFLFEDRGSAVMVSGNRAASGAMCPELGSADAITNVDISLIAIGSGLNLTPDSWIPANIDEYWRPLSEVSGLREKHLYDPLGPGGGGCWPLQF